MKKIKLNNKYIATQGLPGLITVELIPLSMFAIACGWVHGSIGTIVCVLVCLLCTWSAGYSEWLNAKGKVSKLHFGLFCMSFLVTMAVGAAVCAMTEISTTLKLLFVAMSLALNFMFFIEYNNAIHRAEKEIKTLC